MNAKRSHPIPSENFSGPLQTTRATIQLVNTKTLANRAAQAMRMAQRVKRAAVRR